ncbi:DsbA family oxidoreductase [Falsigemmobacter faecalis]|uniref:DsbA family oxidoreductase n=1 Tax=Falsigemmobacter faecalis TaxID=2488730 RepID=A0A3P3DT72_9RHOB|nr:DsbA family oxidoreductase [Falsigemmobacter faecalis]RRH77365.1 DsbA family oxidoreductase [Falsigemmobacter faecalis]
MVTLDIFSDPVCPWCMIGKAYLDRALEKVGDHPFRIEWHPFMLNPDIPAEGVDRRDFLEAKFGGQMEAAKAYTRVMEAATFAGVEFNLEKMRVQPNTLNAHRLIHWAGLEGRQTAVVSALFKAYFRDGLDIGNPDVLADLAAAQGMDRAATLRLLASDADREDIFSRAMDARRKGVQSVPSFLIAREFMVAGAQPVETWISIAEEIAEKLREG